METIEPVAGKNGGITILLTYRIIDGYKSGVYDNGRLIILAGDAPSPTSSKATVDRIVQQLHKDIPLREQKDRIDHVYVYSGANALEESISAALGIAHEIRGKVTLVACHCSWDRKNRVAHDSRIGLMECECGGYRKMKEIADYVLGKGPKPARA